MVQNFLPLVIFLQWIFHVYCLNISPVTNLVLFILFFICFVFFFFGLHIDQLEPILDLVFSWQKLEYEFWPALLDEVQDQCDINAGKVIYI